MKVIAIERGYYGGKIQDPPEAGGEPFHLTSEKHLGKWMEPQGWKPSRVTKPDSTTTSNGGAPQPAFTTKHNGGGRHIVIDADGKKVGDFVGASKEEAQAEADRLTAGGEPHVKPDSTTSNGGAAVDDGGNPDDDDDGPDA